MMEHKQTGICDTHRCSTSVVGRLGVGVSSFLGDSRLKWAYKIALWKVVSSSAGTLGGKQRGGRRFIRELYSAFITRIWSFMVIIICNRIIIRIYLLVSCLVWGHWDWVVSSDLHKVSHFILLNVPLACTCVNSSCSRAVCRTADLIGWSFTGFHCEAGQPGVGEATLGDLWPKPRLNLPQKLVLLVTHKNKPMVIVDGHQLRVRKVQPRVRWTNAHASHWQNTSKLVFPIEGSFQLLYIKIC